jgi:endonuclease/exonuclease/phosphatase family metal-dependent hydrolase
VQLRPAVIDAPAPVAVMGDFNTNDYLWAVETLPLLPLDAVANTSQADALDEYMRAIGYRTPTANFGNTWHGVSEDQRLDSIFTRGMVTGRGDIERELEASDHWPLWLDVAPE